MVFVHSMTPLIPSLAEMLTSATKPSVSRGKKKHLALATLLNLGLSLQCQFQQQVVQQQTLEDLSFLMPHLSEGLQLRSVSCKWLGKLSSQVFWVDWFMTPWIVFSHPFYGQGTGRPAMGLVWLSLSSPHSATRLPPNPQASSIMESINLTIQAT